MSTNILRISVVSVSVVSILSLFTGCGKTVTELNKKSASPASPQVQYNHVEPEDPEWVPFEEEATPTPAPTPDSTPSPSSSPSPMPLSDCTRVDGVISYEAPCMDYPKNNQVLLMGGGYLFKVRPVFGATGYLFGFFQNGMFIHENLRDLGKLSSNGEYGIWPVQPAYANFHEGEVKVWVRAFVNGRWTQARVITITLLKPMPSVSSVCGRPLYEISFLPPCVVYPIQNQVLTHGGGYMIKAEPVLGAKGYLFGFFQDGVMIHENYRDLRTLSKDGEYALWPTHPDHALLNKGNVEVLVRAYVHGRWTQPQSIQIELN